MLQKKIKKTAIVLTLVVVVVICFCLIKSNLNNSESALIDMPIVDDEEKVARKADLAEIAGTTLDDQETINKAEEPVSVKSRQPVGGLERIDESVSLPVQEDVVESVFKPEERLEGVVTENNRDYRDDLYRKLDYELAEYQASFPNPDPVEDMIEQFDNVIDYALGVDFPEEKRRTIRGVQRSTLKRKALLDEISGDLERETYINSLNVIFEESLSEMSDYLTDQEFYALFEVRKEETKGAFSRLIESLKP